MVDIGKLVLAAALPVVEVVLVCSAGAFARWKGILTPEGSKNLARLIYNILLPSLIIVSLSTSVTGPKLLSWWPLPVNVLLNVALGLGLGAATFPFVRLPRHLWAHYVSMAGVGNLGNLLIVLVPSIAEQSEDFDDDDAANGLAYVFTNLFAICIAAFCIAGPLLELPKKDNPCTPTSTPPGIDSGGDSSGQAKQGSEDDSVMHEPRVSSEAETRQTCGGGAPAAAGPVAEGLSPRAEPVHMHSPPGAEGPSAGPRAAAGPCSATCIAGWPPEERPVSPTGREAASFNRACCMHTDDLRHGAGACLAQTDMRRGRPCAVSAADEGAGSATVGVHGVHDPGCGPPSCACCVAFTACTAHSGGSTLHADPVVGSPVWSSDARGAGAHDGPACCATRWVPQSGQPVGEGGSRDGDSGVGVVSAEDDGTPDDDRGGGARARVVKLGKTLLQSLLNPPTAAIVIGICIAVITPLRNVMFTEEEEDAGDAVLCTGPANGTEAGAVSVGGGGGVEKAELAVVTNALARLGGAFLPSLLMNLGAALYQGPGGTEVSWVAIGGLMVIRLVALPVLGTLCVLGARSAGVWSSGGDPMFELVMLLQHAMPSALNLYTLAAMHGNNDKVIAAMLFWQYMVCIFTIPTCVTVFLALVR